MDDHFDTSGVFEINKFDISKFACMSNCLTLTPAGGQFESLQGVPMLHTKFRLNRPAGSGEEDF